MRNRVWEREDEEEREKCEERAFTLRLGEIPVGIPFSFIGQTNSSASMERVRRWANRPRENYEERWSKYF